MKYDIAIFLFSAVYYGLYDHKVEIHKINSLAKEKSSVKRIKV